MNEDKPDRMSIANLATFDVLEAQFNPTQLEENYAAKFGKQTVPGLSHQVKQFAHTEDTTFSIELFWRVGDDGPKVAALIERARRFLVACVHPQRAATTIPEGGAPRVLFVWPTMLTLTCHVTKVRFKHEMFNRRGTSTVYRAMVELEEVRDVLVTMEDILEQGFARTAGGESIYSSEQG